MAFSPFVRTLFFTSSFIVAALVAKAEEHAQQKVLFILDASNSMWGQIDAQAKIEIAKSVLKDLTANMPPDTKMGLAAYGHQSDRKLNNCNDIELVNAVGEYSSEQAEAAFALIVPRGQTPIANTLNEVANWLPGNAGQNTTIVLISDGLESCDGDPCAAAERLNAAGISTAIHVVGFDLTSEQRAKLQCIADNGNGKMFQASDAAGLSIAMNEVCTQIEKPVFIKAEPVVQPAQPVVFFNDDFNADGLTEGWLVLNEAIDSYIAEAGELLILTNVPASSPADALMPNVITHSSALPKEDWDIEVRFKVELQHGAESFYFGVQDDADNWLAGGITTTMVSGQVSLDGFINKAENGKSARFETAIQASSDTAYENSTERWRTHALGEVFGQETFKLVLSKRGRDYKLTGHYGPEGSEAYRAFETEGLKMLRPKASLFLAFGLDTHSEGSHQGEGNIIIDRVTVLEVER